MTRLVKLSASLFVSLAAAAGASKPWDYLQNGADWPADFKGCATTNQSPIDLRTDFPKIEPDTFTKMYKDVTGFRGSSKIKYEYTSDMTTKIFTETSGFTTSYGVDAWGSDSKFKSAQFHFHSGSEHTIDGERFDLEMHTVHFPAVGKGKEGVIALAMGVIFDAENHGDATDEERAVVDEFFESLHWDKFRDLAAKGHKDFSQVVDRVTYGKLMMMLDTQHRYVYKGSVTTPPCATFVHWNVHARVLPVQKKYVDLFRQIIFAKSGAKIAPGTGNYRVICPLDKQDPKMMDPYQNEWVWPTIIIVIVFSAILAGVYWLMA